MSSYYNKRKSYSGASKYAKKYASTKKKPSSYNIKRATYSKGAVKTTAELKQWFFTASMVHGQAHPNNFAIGTPFANAPAGTGAGVFTQGLNEGILALNHAIGQGPGAQQRVGNKITMSSLDLSVQLTYTVTPNADQTCPILKAYVVCDTQWSGAATIQITDFVAWATAGGALMTPIKNNNNRFKILKKIILNPTITLAQGALNATTARAHPSLLYEKSISLKKMDCKYRAATAGQNTPSDVQNNMIFVVFGTNVANDAFDIDIFGSLAYYDA